MKHIKVLELTKADRLKLKKMGSKAWRHVPVKILNL